MLIDYIVKILRINMTDPNKYAFRMLLMLVIVIILIGLLFNPLKEAFEGNSALNGVIVGTLSLELYFPSVKHLG